MANSSEFGVDENTTPEQAIRIAIEREAKAQQFYRSCASIVKDTTVKKLFEFLAKEEGRHQDLLQKEHDSYLAREN